MGESKCLFGYYGQKGKANKKSILGCRRGVISWIDSEGYLWMFGGEGVLLEFKFIFSEFLDVILNDLWYFDLDYKMWLWMGGINMGSDFGSYGLANNEFENGKYLSCRIDVIFFYIWNELYVVGGIGYDLNKVFSLLDDVWGIDVYFDVNYRNFVWFSFVFWWFFLFLSLLVVMVVIFFFVRRG